jgi:capsular polysaccharide biosynthesis protein
MSQQALDLRRSVQIVRRHKILVGIVTALGLLAGAGYAVLNPPPVTSAALVVLPQAAAQSIQAAAGTPGSAGSSGYMETQVVIASSDPVLSGALHSIRPAMSLTDLQRVIEVKSVTNSILSISAAGSSAAQAEATANAVARSYISYVGSAGNGKVVANVLQPAINATRAAPLKRLLVYGLLGALAGALIGFIVALARSREDRRLRERDEIANSIGVPVLASFPVSHPADAAAWTRLLDVYRPGVVHAWQQRRLLQQLGVPDVMLSDDPDVGGCSLTVLSLSSDRAALALGPQLAVFAASQGIPTALIVGPQQNEDATATLRTACGAATPPSSSRPSHLHVAVYSGGDVHRASDAALTVLIAVVDSRAPRMPDTMRTSTTLLGVSAGAATAEQMARVAMSAAADGREITGILVADPESDDRTTGRVPRLARPAHRRLPTRLHGMATEIRR